MMRRWTRSLSLSLSPRRRFSAHSLVRFIAHFVNGDAFCPLFSPPFAINMWHNQVASLIRPDQKSMKPETLTHSFSSLTAAKKCGRRASIFDVSAPPPPPFYVAHSCQLTPSTETSLFYETLWRRRQSRKGIPDLNMAPNNIAFLIGLIAHFLNSELTSGSGAAAGGAQVVLYYRMSAKLIG